jgi:hypothetical protein
MVENCVNTCIITTYLEKGVAFKNGIASSWEDFV